MANLRHGVTPTFSALNQFFDIIVTEGSTLLLSVSAGTLVGTITIAGFSPDITPVSTANYAITGRALTALATSSSTATTFNAWINPTVGVAPGIMAFPVAGLAVVRLILGSFTSGTATFAYSVSSGAPGAQGSMEAAVYLKPSTTNFGSTFHYTTTASTNSTLVKTGTGNVYAYHALNTSVTAKYLKLYAKSTAPTVGTDTPIATILIPALGSYDFVGNGIPWPFPNGIGIGITGAPSDADTTATVAGDVILSMYYL